MAEERIELPDLLAEIFQYIPTEWRDKIDDPEGDLSHPGTPWTARRGNNLEKGTQLAHLRLNNIIAYLEDMTHVQKNLRLEFLLLKASVTSGLTSNIFVENFDSLEDIDLTHGSHDVEDRKIYLR
ncbi:hypothetical protein [Bacillus chungangensis]|uniref:Uncharacterized protein n=1 Tax=Bacillus chungangensis TaxID=587633 RepID=A0ABT9WM56_9BACI|nr:hypothetical protein [Bacillus chungangensis]MDQ0174367.1 hypothetical protein [Bacillus chungangensis]